jgi:type II secretory pathway predicted ATPase ExeA
MVHPTSPVAGRETDSSGFDLGALTRDQRSTATRIANKFREAAAVQVLTGPRECGKTTVALAVAQTLSANVEPVLIAKSGEMSPAQKRLMQEAYGSYPYLLAAILKQLGFYVRGEEHDLVDQMVEQMRKIRREEKRILLILDDAQDFEPEVWKRFQSWLDFQDGGIRMFQVLLVGLPDFKSKLADSALRGWRRWTHARHELSLLSHKSIGEEARRILKQSCEAINARSKAADPITTPSVSWFAIQRIARESGGRPGRLTELVKRTLGASIREGGRRITARFLARADALRSPAVQMYRARKARSKPAPAERQTVSPGGRRLSPPPHPLGWFRYALGFLLIAFVLGAGWGITAWLSMPATESALVADSDDESTLEADEGPEADESLFAEDSSEESFEYDLSDAAGENSLDSDLDESLSPWDDTESPWGAEEASDTESGSGWDSLSGIEVAEATGTAFSEIAEIAEASATQATDAAPLEIQMAEFATAESDASIEIVTELPAVSDDSPLGEIRIEQPALREESVTAAPPAPLTAPQETVTEQSHSEPAPNPPPSGGTRRIPKKKILEHLSRMAKALE